MGNDVFKDCVVKGESLRYFYIFIVCLLCTSCFELRETILIEKGGAGHFRLEADFSGQKDMLDELIENAGASDSFGEGPEPLDGLVKAWVDGAEELNQINGISNALPIVEREQYVFGWEFDFADVNALNLVLALKGGDEYNPDYIPAYHLEKNLLEKSNVFSFYPLLEGLWPKASESQLPKGVENQKKTIFAGIRYSCVVQVKGKIKKSSNRGYRLSSNKKTLTYRTLLSDIQEGKANIGSKIKFK